MGAQELQNSLEVRQRNLTTNWQAYLLIVKGNVGVGCLSMPFFFSILGRVWSLAVFCIIGSIAVYNMWLIVQCKNRVDPRFSFGSLGYHIFGLHGGVISELGLATFQLGVCCVYFSFFGELVSMFLKYHIAVTYCCAADNLGPFFGSKKWVIMILLVLVVIFLTRFRKMTQLYPLSLGGFCMIFTVLLSIAVLACMRIESSSERPPMPKESPSQLVFFFACTLYAVEGAYDCVCQHSNSPFLISHFYFSS
jgi:amino acid permease